MHSDWENLSSCKQQMDIARYEKQNNSRIRFETYDL